MASQDSSSSASRFARLVDILHKNFIWVLLATYGLAAYFPEPGQAIRRMSFSEEVTAPMVLLAVLLFCASAVVRWSQVRELMQHPGILLLALVAIWIIPGIFVSALGWLLPNLPGFSGATGILVALAIIASMPVANSSVAWSQNAQGNVALGLGLIILSIVLSPVATPQMLNFMGLSLSPQETAHCERLVTEFSGTFFIVWVILPALAGMGFNYLVGAERIEKNRKVLRLVSALTLLILNYASGSSALPRALEEESVRALIAIGILAAMISLLGILSAWIFSRLLKLDRSSWVSCTFGFSMKHNGLALVLADKVLHEEPRVILTIVTAIVLQHTVAGCADWYLCRYGEGEEASES